MAKVSKTTLLKLSLIVTALLSTSAFADEDPNADLWNAPYTLAYPVNSGEATNVPGLYLDNSQGSQSSPSSTSSTPFPVFGPAAELVDGPGTRRAPPPLPPGSDKPVDESNSPGSNATEPTTAKVNNFFQDATRCYNASNAAERTCSGSNNDVLDAQNRVNTANSNLSGKTGVACAQLARQAQDAASSVSNAGNACAERVNICRNECKFVSEGHIKSNDENYNSAKSSYDRCARAQGQYSSISSILSQVASRASSLQSCVNDVTGGATPSPNLNNLNPNQGPNWQQQQAQQQQLNCLTNPRGCGAQQTEPFAPTNMAPASAARDSSSEMAPVGGPGNITVPFDGSAILKEIADRPAGGRGVQEPPRGGQKANVASDFRNGSDPAKPKRYQSPSEKVGAEIYRGFMSPQGDVSGGGSKVAAADVKPIPPARPLVGARVAPPLGSSFSKFSGKANDLRQIWSAKLRDASGRGIAGFEFRGNVPTGADGLTGPHTENFKKIRGRYLYLERTLSH